MKSILELQLRDNYRSPIFVDREVGEFIGRKNELRRLVNILSNRDVASVLISGKRGVGKTSLVRSAVREVKAEKEEEILFVDLAISSLESSNKDTKEVTPREIVLKSLIRALYLAYAQELDGEMNVKDEFLKSSYKKTYLKEYGEIGTHEKITKDISTQELRSLNETKVTFEISKELMSLVNKGIASIAAVIAPWPILKILFQFFSVENVDITLVLILYLLFVVIIYLLVSALNLNLTFSREFKQGETKEDQGRTEVSSSSQYDLSPDALEFDLRRICKSFKDKKIVFMIDELDKLPESGTNRKVIQVVESLKNLFSLPTAIFIFVTDGSFYKYIQQEITAEPYPLMHTLFTDKFYLSPHYYRDMEEVIDRMFVKNDLEQLRSSFSKTRKGQRDNHNWMIYRKFRNYICWKSRNHVFDAQDAVEDLVVYPKRGGNRLELKVSTSRSKGNLERDWELIAAMQKYLGKVFDIERVPLEGREVYNDTLYYLLRLYSEEMKRKGSLSFRKDSYLSYLSEEQMKKFGVSNLSFDERSDLEGALQRLFMEFDKFGVVSGSSLKMPDETKGEVVVWDKYDLELDVQYPTKDIMSGRVVLDYEKDFLEMFKVVRTMRRNLLELELDTFQPFENEFKTFSVTYQQILKGRPRSKRRSEIIGATERVNEISADLRNGLFEPLVKDFADGKPLVIRNDVDDEPLISTIDTVSAPFYDFVRQNVEAANYFILTHQSTNKSIFVGKNLDSNVQSAFESVVLRLVKHRKLLLLNLCFEKQSGNKARVFGWSEVKVDDDLNGIVRVGSRLVELFKLISS